MSQSSAKIQIAQDQRTFGIDRSMPAILSGRMSEFQWNKLCDEVDEVVKPLNKLRNIFYIGIFGMILSFVVAALTMSLTFRSSMSSFDSFDSGFSLSALVFLLPVAAMAALVASRCYSSNKVRKALDRVKEICEQTSKTYNGNLSFHLRDDQTVVGDYYSSSTTGSGYRRGYRTFHDIYILVSISAVGAQDPELGGGGLYEYEAQYPPAQKRADDVVHTAVEAEPATSVYAVAEPTTESVEGRLLKLERIKHILSTTEYEEKKKEILAEI